MHKVCIWTPDKDLAQCVSGERVVQVDRRSGMIRDAAGVVEKFGVSPEHIPDYLALVGDSADGYPGIKGIGAVTAAGLIRSHGAIEQFPDNVLGDRRELALLFKTIATLRTDAPLFERRRRAALGRPGGRVRLAAGRHRGRRPGRPGGGAGHARRALTTISGIPASARETGQSLTAWSA